MIRRASEPSGTIPAARPNMFDATVVIAHDPHFLLMLPDHLLVPGLEFVLAGHTHGGQVRLPFFGPLHLDDDLPRSWSMGRSRLSHGHVELYVSRGVGESGVPVRFLCPPEITLVEFRLGSKP